MIIIIMITVMSFMKNGESMVVMKVNITAMTKVNIIMNMKGITKEKENMMNMVLKNQLLKVIEKQNLISVERLLVLKKNGGWSVTIGEVGERTIGDALTLNMKLVDGNTVITV